MMRRAVLVLRLLLGAIFVYAAYTKLRQSWLIFAMSIDAYGVLPEWGVVAVARTLPWLELALGILLWMGWQLRIVALAATATLGVFFAIMLMSWGRGMTIDCGCFGPGEALTWKTLLRDGALLAAAVAQSWMASRKTRVPAGEAQAGQDPGRILLS